MFNKRSLKKKKKIESKNYGNKIEQHKEYIVRVLSKNIKFISKKRNNLTILLK